MSDEVDWDADVNDCCHGVEGPCAQCDAEGAYGAPFSLLGPAVGVEGNQPT